MELYKIHCFFAKKIKNNLLCNLYLILVFKSSFSVVKNITKGKGKHRYHVLSTAINKTIIMWWISAFQSSEKWLQGNWNPITIFMNRLLQLDSTIFLKRLFQVFVIWRYWTVLYKIDKYWYHRQKHRK